MTRGDKYFTRDRGLSCDCVIYLKTKPEVITFEVTLSPDEYRTLLDHQLKQTAPDSYSSLGGLLGAVKAQVTKGVEEFKYCFKQVKILAKGQPSKASKILVLEGDS